MTTEINLTAIVLTTNDGTEIKLSLDDARKLYAQLKELLAEKVVPSPQPAIIEREHPIVPQVPHTPPKPAEPPPWEIPHRAPSRKIWLLNGCGD